MKSETNKKEKKELSKGEFEDILESLLKVKPLEKKTSVKKEKSKSKK